MKLKEHVSDVLNREHTITNLQTDILSNDELNKILKNPELKDGDQVNKAVNDAIAELKGKQKLATLEKLTVPTEKIEINPSPSTSNIGVTS
jgi:phosphoribosylaminoimidazole-succinocarboxamide synthase